MAKPNGIARWLTVVIAAAVVLAGSIIWFSHVDNDTHLNASEIQRTKERVEKIEKQHQEIADTLHRIDTRQVIIMHKLGAEEPHRKDVP